MTSFMIKGIAIVLCVLCSGIAIAQTPEIFNGHVLVQLEEGRDPNTWLIELQMAYPEAAYKLDSRVSDHMRIWLLTFDETIIPSPVALRQVKEFIGVTSAQFNHIIRERIVPDDPFFGNQWHHQNSEDHDIDSEFAWDITTGGTTTTGDRVVVCVIETNGANWDVADLVDNHWLNENEIPDNGIDDDENGYVDDVDGWNVQANNDEIPEGNHGTQVSGMIGATGNNGAGIVGVNWDVDIMQVRMGSITESNVLAAYTYPLKMRKLYNETNGQKGAFVVATNASWGTDFGQPSDAPLWCAMYDSLGVYGVLSCGATANNNVNVDLVGDLPTTCPSNFLISVTATDINDIRDFSGYGSTHIDLGAPGDQVYLVNNNGYGNASGTSFASPCVAGAVALLYSAPCTSLMIQAYADPESTASMVRDYILNGIDPVSNLSEEVATGGRLNVNNSLQLVMANCQEGGCISPFAISTTQIEGSLDYLLEWMITEAMFSFNLRYRPIDANDWISANEIETNEYGLADLLSCTSYEVQLQANCEEEGQSEWSSSYIFITDGCCVNPDPQSYNVEFLENNEVTVSWNEVFAAEGYTVLIAWPNGNTEEISATSNITINYEPCSVYTISVFSVCVGPEPAPSSITFNTPGCGSCQDLTYCEITGNATVEYIERVALNTFDNMTASDNGYGDYTSISTDLNVGGTYTIDLTPGYAGFGFNEQFKVWIDYNSDGEFASDNEELIYTSPSNITSTVSYQFEVPDWVIVGSHVRMRVSMSYGGDSTPTEACGDLNDGEAEDYCISFLPVSIEENNREDVIFYPNPTHGFLRVNYSGEEPSTFVLFDYMARELMRQTGIRNGQELDISHLPSGVYQYLLRSDTNEWSGRVIKK